MALESDCKEPSPVSLLVPSMTLGSYRQFLSFNFLLSKTGERAAPSHRCAPWEAYKAWHVVSAQMPLLVTLVVLSPVGHCQLHSHMSAVSYRYNSKGPFYWADIERKGLLDLFHPCPMSAPSSRSPGSPTGLVSPVLEEASPGTGSLRVPSP